MHRKFHPHIFLTVLVFLLAGCGGILGRDESPQAMLEDAAAHMSSLEGYQFQLAHSGSPAYIDAQNSTEFLNATGHFVAPDRVETTIKISLQSIVAEISVISLGDQQWASNPLTGAYQAMDDSFSYRPTLFFDPEEGFFATLGEALVELEIMGEEELDEMPGLKLQHMQGSLPGDTISEVSYGLIQVESMLVDIWLDPGADEIHRITLTDPATAGAEELSVWELDFWNFGGTKDIQAPEG